MDQESSDCETRLRSVVHGWNTKRKGVKAVAPSPQSSTSPPSTPQSPGSSPSTSATHRNHWHQASTTPPARRHRTKSSPNSPRPAPSACSPCNASTSSSTSPAHWGRRHTTYRSCLPGCLTHGPVKRPSTTNSRARGSAKPVPPANYRSPDEVESAVATSPQSSTSAPSTPQSPGSSPSTPATHRNHWHRASTTPRQRSTPNEVIAKLSATGTICLFTLQPVDLHRRRHRRHRDVMLVVPTGAFWLPRVGCKHSHR